MICYCWLVGFYGINLYRLFNAKSSPKRIIRSISNNSVLREYTGARGLRVIARGNGHDDTSSNSRRD